MTGVQTCALPISSDLRVEQALKDAGLTAEQVSLDGNSVRARFAGTDTQLKAKDAVQKALIPDAADPHLWMDPVLWAEASGSIAPALARLLPDHASMFEANLATLRSRLAALHEYGARVMASIPPRQRLLVTAHDAFGYFAARYGLEVDSIQGLSTESEANLARIEALVRALVDRRIPAVFSESSVPDRAVRALIEGAGARGLRVALGGTLFSDSMGKPGSYEGTYHGMLDHNFTTIARALGGDAPARGMLGRLTPS